MPNIVMTIPDAFKANPSTVKDLIPSLDQKITGNSGKAGATIVFDVNGEQVTQRFVRRPLSGIALKPNTHAFFQVVKSDGTVVKVFNEIGSISTANAPNKPGEEGGPLNEYWTDFFLQSVTESRQEKVQLLETFGVPILYVFGERPRILQFTGSLMNTADFSWRSQFLENWDKYFRATALVESDSQLFIGFDDIIVNGYPFSTTVRQSSVDNNIINFNFSFYVVGYTNTTMQNVGALQKNRGTLAYQTANANIKVSRASEFLNTGSFADPLYKDNVAGSLGSIVAGPNLSFVEYWKSKLGGLNQTGTLPGGTTISANDLLFNSALRYIKGGKTAAEYLLSFMNRTALQYAYQGVERIGAKTPGGVLGLNFYYGLIGHLYQSIAINAMRVPRTELPLNHKWTGLVDNIAQLGNPYALASYMGYASVAAASVGIYGQTDKFALANMDYDVGFGLVAKGQGAGYGAALSRRIPTANAFNPDALTLSRDVPLKRGSSSSLSVADISWNVPESVPDPGVLTSATDPSSKDFNARLSASQAESEAVDAQRADLTVNHGSINVIQDPKEVEDDGSET